MCCVFMKVEALVANLCKAMLNPDMHDKLCGHMQALVYDPTSMPRERPPCKTLITPSLHHEEEGDGFIMMHEDSPQGNIQEDATYPKLSKEKDGSDSPIYSDSDAASRRQHVQCLPALVKKWQLSNIPMHAHAKGYKRDEESRKRKKMPSSSFSLSSSSTYSLPSSPSSFEDEESNSSPN